MIRPRDLHGIAHLGGALGRAILEAQPRTVEEAFAIPGVGPKIIWRLIERGCLPAGKYRTLAHLMAHADHLRNLAQMQRRKKKVGTTGI